MPYYRDSIAKRIIINHEVYEGIEPSTMQFQKITSLESTETDHSLFCRNCIQQDSFDRDFVGGVFVLSLFLTMTTDVLREPLLKTQRRVCRAVPWLEAEYVDSTIAQRTVLRRPLLDFRGTCDFFLVAQFHDDPMLPEYIRVDRQDETDENLLAFSDRIDAALAERVKVNNTFLSMRTCHPKKDIVVFVAFAYNTGMWTLYLKEGSMNSDGFIVGAILLLLRYTICGFFIKNDLIGLRNYIDGTVSMHVKHICHYFPPQGYKVTFQKSGESVVHEKPCDGSQGRWSKQMITLSPAMASPS